MYSKPPTLVLLVCLQDFGLYQDVMNGAAISVTVAKSKDGRNEKHLVSMVRQTHTFSN